MRLEGDLAAELHNARIEGTGHLAKLRVVQARIDAVVLERVEGVEGLPTELEVYAFSNRKGLIERCREVYTA